jgi:dTDP-4-dehydrorhamnose 3,5-epimerase
MKKPELIKNNVFVDNRGTFAPLSLKTLNQKWIQSNISINPNKYTLRGLHYQYGKSAQAKLLKVIDGKILDFIIDLRPYSEEYNKISFFLLEPGDELYVPFDFAHGFITLKDNTIVQYLVDNKYDKESERCILWSTLPEIEEQIIQYDSEFNKNMVIISEKDLIHNP